jgi:hypothetical protein
MKNYEVPNYRKSTFSDRSPRDRCVEVAIMKDRISVRNSRDKSVALEFTSDEWDAFIRGVKQNEFDILR